MKVYHKGFVLILLIKAVDGVLEVLSSIMLLVIPPKRFYDIAVVVTQHELAEDPHDFIANMILHLSQNFSMSTEVFATIYLFSHGLIKILLVLLLAYKKYWAYPVTIVFLSIFVAYQLHRFMYSRSAILLILMAIDIIMIGLVMHEFLVYKKGLTKP